MARSRKEKGNYSLRRRIQVLAVLAILVASFLLTVGLWITGYLLRTDAVNTTRFGLVLALKENIGLIQYTDRARRAADRARENEQWLAELADLNPELWYYVEWDGRVIRSGPGDPKYRHRVVADARLSPEGEDPGRCAIAPSALFFWNDDTPPLRYVESNTCGDKQYYVEVDGLETGKRRPRDIVAAIRYNYAFGGRTQRNLAGTAAVALVLAGLVTLVFAPMTTRIREISQAASRIGRSKELVRLPEENLPREILPMVQATNHAIARLEAASEQQRLFAAAAAHELRTPLAVHRARIEALPDSELKQQLDDDVEHMASMIRQLLALAKLRSVDGSFETLDLAKVVEDICVERGAKVLNAGKELVFDGGGDKVRILGDRGAVNSAVVNLIDNAIEFTPDGKTVRVTVDRNKVTVQDEGPGVPEEDVRQVFEPFFKHPPNKRGHGIGLAIVAKVMSMHNGSVSTRNAPEGGAVFELTFPYSAAGRPKNA